jgi:hypothetical protein
VTLEELREKVRQWDSKYTGPIAEAKYGRILSQLEYHAEKDWRVYLPTEHSDFNPSYMERLASWVGNISDESEQQLLLEYALFISFFSHDDFTALYRTAIDREVTRWIATQAGVRLENRNGDAFDNEVHKQIHKHTWFCPITDSMDINEFYKVNHLQGVGHRPTFSTLQMLAEGLATPDPSIATNVTHYMANPNLNTVDPSPPLQRIVLLEDIVGSGDQCFPAVQWAVKNLGKPVLFIPIIVCPKGADALRLEAQRSNGILTVSPVIEVGHSDLLGPERNGNPGWDRAVEMEALATSCMRKFMFQYPAFGFEDTGCSLVTFSNTPDNTLPVVHNKTQTGWAPLFPRVYRDS